MVVPSVTFDIEDPRPSPDLPARHAIMTRTVLDLLDAIGVQGTFFVVGELARSEPDLVREIAVRGHELGLHGWKHVSLDKLGRDEVRDGLARGKALLEELGGRAVRGYRAPIFSVVPETRWVTELLAEAGFAYSSSVMPAANPQFGDASAPPVPFRWPSGVLELPATVRRFGPATMPFLGGFYLRALPSGIVRRALAAVEPGAAPWVYLHPYDFDADEAPYRLPWASWWVSRLLFTRRRHTERKLRAVLDGGAAPPLGTRVETGEFADALVLSAP